MREQMSVRSKAEAASFGSAEIGAQAMQAVNRELTGRVAGMERSLADIQPAIARASLTTRELGETHERVDALQQQVPRLLPLLLVFFSLNCHHRGVYRQRPLPCMSSSWRRGCRRATQRSASVWQS
jgi:hypothetical protein